MAFGLGAKSWAGKNEFSVGTRASWTLSVEVAPCGLGEGVGGAVPADLLLGKGY